MSYSCTTDSLEEPRLEREIREIPEPQRHGGWLGKSVWAVADQGLFAVTNFAVNVLLARRLPADDYGAFAVAFAAFLLLGTIHNALLTEPMLVFGPQRRRRGVPAYLGTLLCFHGVVGLIPALVLGLAGAIAAARGHVILGKALGGLAVAAPCILLLWLVRRACYVQLNPRRAALAGAGYFVGVMLGIELLHRTETLSMLSAIALMGGGSCVAGVWLAWRQGVRLHGRTLRRAWPTVANRHWRYGRWAMAAGLVGFVPGNIYYLLLPLFTGVQDSGALRALSNLAMPFLQANAALGVLLLPVLVRAGNAPAFSVHVRRALAAMVGVPTLAWLICGLWHNQIIALLYGGRFSQVGPLVWFMGLVPVCTGVIVVYGQVVRARQRPEQALYAAAAAAVASIVVGVPLMAIWGLPGVVVAMVANAVVEAVVLWGLSCAHREGQISVVTDERGEIAEEVADAA